MALLYPSTGFKTIGNGAAPYFSGKHVYTNIWDAHDQVIGILKFTTSVANKLGISVTKWSDLKITKATLKLKVFRKVRTDATYTIAISGTTIETHSTVSTITNNSYYLGSQKISSGSNIADSEVTFDLTQIFNNIPDSNSSTPATNTWYIYIWNTAQYTAGSDHTDDYGFYESNGSIPSLEITGYSTKSTVEYFTSNSVNKTCLVKYYNTNDSKWHTCIVKYWDDNYNRWRTSGEPPS